MPDKKHQEIVLGKCLRDKLHISISLEMEEELKGKMFHKLNNKLRHPLYRNILIQLNRPILDCFIILGVPIL